MISKMIEPGIDKAEAFDRLAQMYYNHNFGNCTKSDVDLQMFMIYFEAAKKAAADENGFIDENLISDYKIGKALGITPARVKNLRLKMELLYPDDNYDWRKDMAAVLAGKRSLSAQNGQVEITIRSKNLMNAVQDWAEDQGEIVGMTFNSKVICLSIGCLFDLMDVIFEDDEWKKIRNRLRKDLKMSNTAEKFRTVLSSTADITAICSNIVSTVNPVSQIGGAFCNIISLLNNLKGDQHE